MPKPASVAEENARAWLAEVAEGAGSARKLAFEVWGEGNEAARSKLTKVISGAIKTVDVQLVADVRAYVEQHLPHLMPGQGDGDTSQPPKVPGVSADTSRATPSDERPGEVLVYPVAPHGHGAAEIGQSNTDAAPIAPIQIPALLMRRWTGGRAPAKGFWTFAVGNSMEPFIPDGHPVFVEPIDGPLVDGARYAVWLGEADEDVIKRVSIGPDGTITLYGDNPAVRSRTLRPTENPDVWKDGKGTVRLVIQGRVILPSDTAPAIIGQITEFARSLIRPYES